MEAITKERMDKEARAIQRNLNKAIEIVQAQPSHPQGVEDPQEEMDKSCHAIANIVNQLLADLGIERQDMTEWADEWVQQEYAKQHITLYLRLDAARKKLEGLGVSHSANMNEVLQVANDRANAFKEAHNWFIHMQEDMQE